MTILQNRYDFVFFFDVENGNPNGDPDAGNLPRMDPETNHGLVSDVSLKRKLRNYIATAKEGQTGYEIYMAERAVLNQTHARAYKAKDLKSISKKLPRGEDGENLTRWMCQNFFDIRAFGAVMTTEVNCGQVRGPVQISFARSEEPIMPLEISITRSSVTNEKDIDKERTMGRKHIVPYALYRVHGFINANFARKSGFTECDLQLVWDGFRDMFDFDRSAARGLMASRRLVAFRHESNLGNAQAHKLFDRISVHRSNSGECLPVGDPRTHNLPASRSFNDYRIEVNQNDLPEGITVIEPFDR